MTTKEFLRKLDELGFDYRIVFTKKNAEGRYVSQEMKITYSGNDIALVDLCNEYTLNLTNEAMVDLPINLQESIYELLIKYVATKSYKRGNDEELYLLKLKLPIVKLGGVSKHLAYDILKEEYVLVSEEDKKDFLRTALTFNEMVSLDDRSSVFKMFKPVTPK